MPLRRIQSSVAFATLKANPVSGWPRRDDPDNRFAHFADPSFQPRFLLEPGQRIVTIGSCFARGVERALAERGFDIPTLAYQVEKPEWDGDPTALLNNYVPPAIAPQIRWAFGLERFDIDQHCLEMGRSKFVDLQLPNEFRPAPRDLVERRREIISGIFRTLESSHVVILTLGLIEAWFDTRSGLYINRTPPKGADPSRFELHVLDYNDVTTSLEELVALFGQVCPGDYRLILTVSPVPLTATFTDADVAVANSYSKSVLRAAVEPLVARHGHVEYFPSYESVLLTERAIAFGDDQVHVSHGMVRFNVDRMIRKYAKAGETDTVSDIIARAREDRRMGLFRVALGRLQRAWTEHPDHPQLAVALADLLLRAGNGPAAEAMLLAHLEKHDTVGARVLLARYYNNSGRHEAAALQTEKAFSRGGMRLLAALERVTAYYHLDRLEEGLAILESIKNANERRPTVFYWKARFCEKLGRTEEADQHYRYTNTLVDEVSFKAAYADFLGSQKRWDELAELTDQMLLRSPAEPTALRWRAVLGRPGGQHRPAGRLDDVVRRVRGAAQHRLGLLVRAVNPRASRAAAQASAFVEED
jgi:tetratricopeptide (TPR) repeat protein